MLNFYVTYGYGSNQRNNYSVVEAADMGQARSAVFEQIGPKWSMIYDEEDFAGMVEEYGMTEIPLAPHVIPSAA